MLAIGESSECEERECFWENSVGNVCRSSSTGVGMGADGFCSSSSSRRSCHSNKRSSLCVRWIRHHRPCKNLAPVLLSSGVYDMQSKHTRDCLKKIFTKWFKGHCNRWFAFILHKIMIAKKRSTSSFHSNGFKNEIKNYCLVLAFLF